MLLVALATGGRVLLDPYMGDSVPYVTYFLSSAIIIRYTGLGPSVLAIVLSTCASDYLFLPPRYTLTFTGPQAVTSFVFVLANMVMVGLAHAMRRSKEEAETNARLAETHAKLAQANASRMNRSQEISHLGSWELDLQTNQLTWSDEVYRIFGLQPQEFGASYQAFLDAIHPEDRQRVDAAYTGSVREGRDSYEIEHRIVRKATGEVRIVHERCEHSRDASGRIIRSVGMVQDITERKKAEEGLRDSEAKFRFLAESIPPFVWSARPDGYIEHVNARALDYLGKPLEQLLGWNWISVLHPDDVQHTREAWEEAFTTGKEYRLEYRLRRASDGQYRWYLAHALPFRDAQGRILHWFGTCTDIHDRKEAENGLRNAKEQLRKHAESLEQVVQERTIRLQELVGELEHFSYTLSHDMRAPLRAMSGFAQMMWEGGCSSCINCDSKNLLERIMTSARRMDLLITEALDYSKAVRAELKLVPVDAGAVLREIVSSYPNLQPIYADIILDGSFPVVMANEAALTQCFSNLLGNAVKFVSPKTRPHIRVRSERQAGSTIRFWFEDNGIGIAPEDLPKLFGMFQRVNSKYEGTGIGLALVRKNTERMGGRVGVESELEKGSRFWIDLKEAVTIHSETQGTVPGS